MIEETTLLSLQTYIEAVINHFGVKSNSETPESVSVDLRPKKRSEERGDWPFMQAGGCLTWVGSFTRSGIDYCRRTFHLPHYGV